MATKNIAILTSGGDSPGMNPCINAIFQAASKRNWNIYGVFEGFKGLIDNNIKLLGPDDVKNIIQLGGTILKSARSKRFFEKSFRDVAAKNLKSNQIDTLIVIGGDGSFKGASLLGEENNIEIIGIPGTIDNDMFGTDATIGYDTALNTVVDAVDKINDTAHSHNRMFFVEVMGRDAGFIALRSGIACGAEAILIPEEETSFERLFETLNKERSNDKSGIVIVAEGDDGGGAFKTAELVRQKFPDFDIRVSILGHIQRGGKPSAYDRVLASRLGLGAVEAIESKLNYVMVGIIKNDVVYTSFQKAVKHHKSVKPELLKLANAIE